MKKHLVFITDCTDLSYNELRGTVLSQLHSLDTSIDVAIEPVVSIEPFSLINGSFALRLMAENYPPGTIFSVIINPLRERPARLIGKTKLKGFYFLGADTGVFSWFLKDFGIEELYELHDPGFLPFGGKFVHAPAAAQIMCGKPLESLGSEFEQEKLRHLEIPNSSIVHIDCFGLMKFKGDLPDMQEGAAVSIEVAGKSFPAVYAKRMMSRETGKWVVFPGSSLGLPELGKVRINGAKEIGARIGDLLKVIP